jgi:hypothetical protein
MRLTTEQIKQIIKEELSRVLYEEERELTLRDLNLSDELDFEEMYGLLWDVFKEFKELESAKQYIELASSLTGVGIDLDDLRKKAMVKMYKDDVLGFLKIYFFDKKAFAAHKPAIDKLKNWDGSMEGYKDFAESLAKINKELVNKLKDDESDENMMLRQNSIKLYQNGIVNKRILNYIFIQTRVDDKSNYEAAWQEAEKTIQIPIVFQAYHTFKEEVEKVFGSEPDNLKRVFSFDNEG